MRKRSLFPVLAVLLTAPLVTTGAGPEPPECVAAAAWVKANPDALPSTLPELSRFSVTYRRAIYQALPGETRAALWRAHLEGFLSPASGLNDAQRAAVREVIPRLPALTAEGSDPEARKAVARKMAVLFPRELGVRIFTTLGPAPVAASGKALPLCDCSFDESFDECGGGNCTTNRCSFTSSGCGPFWMDACFGVCRFFRSAE